MWINDVTLKMYMDAAVRERLAEAQRSHEVARTTRLRNLVRMICKLQALEEEDRRHDVGARMPILAPDCD